MREYDLIADWYASERTDQTGVPEVRALAESLAPRSLVLDIGCGNGIPLTRALTDAGHRVIGIDSARRMLAHFHKNWPQTPAVHGSVEALPFRDRTFDGAIAWGVMFHLPQPAELAAIESIARVLKPGAPFLFTSGDDDGTQDDFVGTMNGVTFHYYSFTADDYRRHLGAHGLVLEGTHADAGANFYYLCRRT